MTLQDLENYASLRREIAQTRKRLQKIHSGGTITHGTVRGSSKQLPYQEHVITVYGIPIRDRQFVYEIEGKLRARIKRFEEQTVKVESFIDTVTDSTVRQIIALRYIDGLEWRQVARRVYGNYNENTPRMRVQRFFEKIT